jgi:hypothetical protein
MNSQSIISNNSNIKLFSFLQLKPNSDKNINSILLELILKLLNSNDLQKKSPDVDDILSEINDNFINHTKDNPIKFINNFFKNQLEDQSKNQLEDQSKNQLEDQLQYYNIMSYNCYEDKYNLMLVNNQINSSSYIKNLNDSERENHFNLLASLLIKYYTNSEAIFGDVFLISIDKNYYDILLEISNINNIQNENQQNTLNKKLNLIKNIYYDISPFNFLESYASITYVKIYEYTTKRFVYYSREYLNNFLKNISSKSFLHNQIIKINYEKIELYIKYNEPLPGSHYNVLDIISKDNTQYNEINEYNIVNITEFDISTLDN